MWDPPATRELVVSVIRSFPAGTVLLMQGGEKVFAPREFEGAPGLDGATPSYIVLDGQQRLTSLYQAFTGVGTHAFFLNLQELLDGSDVDDAVEVYLRRRARKWATIDGQARDLMLPLSSIRDFANWVDDLLEAREQAGDGETKKLKAKLNELEKEHVKAVEAYQFPVTTLSAGTPVEAICTIFETLNRTGVKLSVFELLTARAFAHDERLRQRWEEALAEFPILSDYAIDPYYVLQTIAVKLVKTPKRSAVLGLAIPDLIAAWDEAIAGMAGALKLLRDECGVLAPKWIAYGTMLITMAAAWPAVVEVGGAAVGDRRAKLRRWFWCSTYSGAYDNAANSRTEADVPALGSWLRGGDPPSVVEDFSFDSQRWREITPRQRALYQATISLAMRNTPLDFHDGTKLDTEIINGRAVDDHHIFPQQYLKDTGKATGVDSVLNHTLISKETNIRIGKKAPSVYLGEIERELGPPLLGKILTSHLLSDDPTGPLLSDNFEGFLEWRLDRFAKALAEVTSD